MARLVWDNMAERYFETGVTQGVLFLKNDDGTYATGVPWSGLISVAEKHSGGDAVRVHADDAPYMNILEVEGFEATIQAYTYPDEFEKCDGFYSVPNTPMSVGFQERQRFALCYKTTIGNDVDGIYHGSKIHILYDCIAKPAEREYETINESPELMTFSWDIQPGFVGVTETTQTPIVIIDSRKTYFDKIEEYLYGTDEIDSQLLLPSDIIEEFAYTYLATEYYMPIEFGGTRILV